MGVGRGIAGEIPEEIEEERDCREPREQEEAEVCDAGARKKDVARATVVSGIVPAGITG